MTWQFWKSKEEQLKIDWDDAVNLRNQGKWLDAAAHFANVEKLSREATDPNAKAIGPVARALSMLFYARGNYNGDTLAACYQAMAALDPMTSLEIPYTANAGEVAQEVLVLSQEARLKPLALGAAITDPSIAQDMENIAQSYMGLGKEKLVVSGLFSITDTTLNKSLVYMGLSRIVKAKMEEARDPVKAVDYYSEAIGYLSQINDQGFKKYAEERSRKLITSAKCWLCGRPVQGEDINFVYLRSYIDPFFSRKFENEMPPVIKNDTIVACKACYGAMALLSESISDRIAKIYYDRAMAELQKVHDHLDSRINECMHDVATHSHPR